MTNMRQQEAIMLALKYLDAAQSALDDGAGNEIVADDLRHAFGALEIILGKISSEDVLNTVFGSFCIGK